MTVWWNFSSPTNTYIKKLWSARKIPGNFHEKDTLESDLHGWPVHTERTLILELLALERLCPALAAEIKGAVQRLCSPSCQRLSVSQPCGHQGRHWCGQGSKQGKHLHVVSQKKLPWEILWNNPEDGYVGGIVSVFVFTFKPLFWVETTVGVMSHCMFFHLHFQKKEMEAQWK